MRAIGQAASYIDQLIHEALEKRASDVHIEPQQNTVKIKFRIDGILQSQEEINVEHHRPIVARLKVLACLNTAERRIPQDGKFLLTFGLRSIDIRVATFPCIWGERVVLRLLDVYSQLFDLKSLGITEKLEQKIQRALQVQQGCILVTGPTGSGKTTTLHALLRVLFKNSKHIITLEDPVEYTIPEISQAHIRADIGFSFDNALRSVLRQDPDVIMIGEIRDSVTAYAAFRAALTGHLMLSSVHAHNAVTVIARLLDMNIEPFFVAHALHTVIAQRLVRTLCHNCRIKRQPNKQEQAALQYLQISLNAVYTSLGCEQCNGLAFIGRAALFELLEISSSLKELIIQKQTEQALIEQARYDGLYSLSDHAASLLSSGITSVSEVMRTLA